MSPLQSTVLIDKQIILFPFKFIFEFDEGNPYDLWTMTNLFVLFIRIFILFKMCIRLKASFS